MARKKGRSPFLPEHTAGVSEDFKKQISKILETFKQSNKSVYTFEAAMSKQERAMVHLLCSKMGLRSRSSGKGNQRHVIVRRYENSKKETPDEEEHINSFGFSEESKRILMDLFTHYPPGEDQISEQNLHEQTRNTDLSQGRRDDIFLRPLMSKVEIARKMKSLTRKVETSRKLSEIFLKRSKLPIASFQGAISSTVANHQVVLICGETGCGKTTQVPQYLLDYMWAKGEACKIICTQPRRISAISVSERISHERGEMIGDSVGYKIRLETRGGRQSSILFCTSGILLRVLVSSRESQSELSQMKAEKSVSELTHIIVDEIHERDRYSDFLLTILRDLLPAHPHLRLVLMSATIDAERFSEYFGGCPIIRVPGFTHPVKTFYLEDVLSMLETPKRNHLNATTSLPTCPREELQLGKEYQEALDEAIEMSFVNDEFDSLLELISSEGKPEVVNAQHSSSGMTPLMVFAGKGRVNDVCTLLSLGADCHLQAHDGSTALDWAKHGDQTEAAEIIKKHMEAASSGSVEEQQLLKKYMTNVNPELIDYVLIEQLLKKVCLESTDGAILVFLPGWEDISKTQKALLAKPFFNDSSRFLVLPLHSMVPSADQKKVFQRPPLGCRKIILSTNIAETSVTIDDVVYVIDTGRMKEKSYDPLKNVSTLQSSWISKASAKQREGRAGRCQPGVCYHLYSKLKAVSLADFQVPEIKRMPIEELCLQVKMLDPNCKVDEFLKKTLDPPVLETMNNALAVLQDIGALTPDEELTDLGKKLGSLPVHPLTSRMLFFSILLNCLEPALTLACAADYRDPFTLPMLPHDKLKADAARAKLASLYGGHSDQLATVAAFDCWKSARERHMESWFCSEYYVSANTMSMLSGMRKQLLNELKRCGFVPNDASTCSMNSRDPGIVRAVVVAGLYPRIGKLKPAATYGKSLVVETVNGDRARLLSRSIITKFTVVEFNKDDEGLLLLYDEVTRGDSGLQVRYCTAISPLPLLLLAKEIAVASRQGNGNGPAEENVNSNGAADGDREAGDKGPTGIMTSPGNSVKVVVDGWISYKTTALEVAQIYCLRERLSSAILFKISNPNKGLPPPLAASIYAIACLMAYDGLTGISRPVAPLVDILTSLAYAPDAVKKKVEGVPRNCKYFLGSMARNMNGKCTFDALQSDEVQGESTASEEILPAAQTKPVLVHSPLTTPPQESPTLGQLLVNPPSLPARITRKKRKRITKPERKREESQPVQPTLTHAQTKPMLLQPHGTTPAQKGPITGSMIVKLPSVQATSLKKRKRKNKAKTHVAQPILGPAFINPPSAPVQAKPARNTGLDALVGYGSNPFGPYGPRGR